MIINKCYRTGWGFPGGASSKESVFQCKRHIRCWYDPWVRKIPWSREWHSTPVFLPEKSYGQRSLVSYNLLLLLLLSRFSRVQLCATPQTAAHQAPPSLGFSRQEHWNGLPFPFPVHESEKWKWSRSVVSDSSKPHGLHPTRLLCPWDSPGKSTGVGCHPLLRATTYGAAKS